MNAISTIPQTMSSREIAELTDKRHDSVKRTIETLAERGAISQPQIVDGAKSANGVVEKLYLVGKRDSYVIVAQLSPEFTARLVDRWQELEAAAAAPRELSRLELITLALDSEQGRIKAEAERDRAIQTKAQISSSREARAVALVGVHKREAERLKDQLGFSARHATVMQVEAATKLSYPWLPLRTWCKDHGVTAEVVPDKRYPNGVKAWPAAAWMEVYGVDLVELFGDFLGGVAA